MRAGNKTLRSYLKFNVSGVNAAVQSAVIRLTVTNASDDGGSIFSVANAWDEGSITFNNAPAISGNALSSAGAISVGDIVEFDVTSVITGNGPFSFCISNNSGDRALYSSKEGAVVPELVIQMGAGGGNQPPVANAGADQIVTDIDNNGSENVTLDGSGSSDPDGTIASYEWREQGNLLGSGATPTVTLTVGSHAIDLTVTDNNGSTASDQVVVTVNAGQPGNQPPVANAGPDQNVTDANNNGSENVALDGSASFDPDGTIVSYEWRENANLIASGSNPTVTLAVGTHTIDLTVTDNNGATAVDQVVIAVNANQGGGNSGNTFIATDDAYVRTDNPGGNFGGSKNLRVRNSGALQIFTYLKFNITGLSGPVVSAKVRLSVVNSSDDGGSIFSAANNWNENNVTFLTSPTVSGGPLSSVGAVAVGDVVEFDVTSVVNGNGTFSFCINSASRDVVRYSSKEGNVAPELVIATDQTGNQPPLANAGPDQTVTDNDNNGTELIVLDGSGSSDADGSIVNFEWRENTSLIATGSNPNVTLAVGTHTLVLTVTDDGGSTATDQVVVTVNPFQPGNQPPVANAGPDQTITDADNNGSEPITLDGSASFDADGTIVNYEWSENATVLASGANASPQITLAVGTHTINLTVTDNNGVSATDQVVVAVNPPIGNVIILNFNPIDDAYVKSDQPGRNFGSRSDLRARTTNAKTLRSYLKFNVSGVNGTVLSAKIRLNVLVGSNQGGSMFAASNDWNESTITFDNAPPISGIALSSLGAVNKGEVVEFDVTPAIAINGIVSFCLGSSSGSRVLYSSKEGAIVPELIVEVGEGGNQPPVANAGPDQVLNDTDDNGSESVTLNGSASADPDGSIVSYVWSENGNQIATGANPTVALALGSHNISLTVTDNDGAAANDLVVIKVNQAPVAHAGANQIVTDVDRNGAQSVTLDGTLSTDADGAVASYSWSEGANIIGTGATPSVTLTLGVHTIDLTVTDDDGATATDQVVITINDPPVANAGLDQSVPDADNNGNEDIALDGSSSTDSDGTIVSYVWSEAGTQIATGVNPTVTLAVGVHNIDLVVTDNVGATSLDQVVVAVGANLPPTANAGPNQLVLDTDLNGTENVVLDASASTDDGSITSYAWTEGGTPLAAGVNPTVSLALGVHTIGLTVTDNAGATGTDQVIITVNQAPVANAGPDQTVSDSDNNGSENITLDGSGSSDADGSIVSYIWTEGTTQLATGATPLVALNVGVYTIDLTITDNYGTSITDQVVITVDGNQPPVANAGADQSVADTDLNGSEDVTLDGSASTDDGSIVSYVWSENATQIATGINPLVTLAVGVHNIDLTVTDNLGATGTDQVIITVNAGGNQPPTANAGPDQILADADNTGSEDVTLDASASTDDGSIVSYVWSENATQIATGVNPLVTLAVGSHSITLTVTDDLGATATDQVLIVVNANQPPVADAGPNQTLTDADLNGLEDVTLDGSASSDNDGAIVSYEWGEAGTPIATGINPLVTLAVGTHTIDLVVTDDGGATATDQVVITVTPVFTLSLDASPTNSGTTSPAVGTTTNHQENDVVSISAAPNAGFVFINWTGATGIADPNSANTTVIMDGDKTITANFAPTVTLTLLVSPAASGTTIPAEGTVTTYTENDVVSISASPNPGFTFLNWTGDNSIADPNSASTTVLMDADKTITANFVAGVNLTMNVFPTGGGTTTPAAGNSGFTQGTSVQISASPNPGFIFGYWSGIAATEADAQTTTVTLNSDTSITANFIEIPPASGETTASSLGLSGSMQAYGPLSIFGFPTYYTDSNGLSLVHGVNVNDPLTPENLALTDPALLPDANAPLDISTENFFEESFYFSGSALLNTASGTAILVHAGGEAVFFTPDLSVQDGFQTTFSRFRVRIDLPAFSGETRSYTVTHPYGVETFEVTAGGLGAINLTIDSALQPGFESPLDGSLLHADPFLVWTGGEAPAGYVGDPGVDHTVTGSPFNTNFFRIEGPDIGGPGVDFVQTNLFSVSGKIIGNPPPPPPANEPPVAYAGPDQIVATVGNNNTVDVDLFGGASFDVDGNIASYIWTESSTQIATTATPTITLAVGTHTITLTVTDNAGATHSDDVVITVNFGNPPPVANAGSDQTVTDTDNNGSEDVTLDANGSTDDGTIVSYIWSEAGTQIATGVNPTVTLTVGTHTIDLLITDDGGATDTDQVVVTVNPGAVFSLNIAVSPANGGTTTPAAGTSTDFPANSTVNISATPNAGFQFVNWTGTGIADPNSPNTTVTMDANKTVTANFILTYTLTVGVFPVGGGTTTPAEGSVLAFTDGAVVNITATPNPGYVFAYWSGVPAVDADAQNGTVTMDANKAIIANFIEKPPANGETTAVSLGLSGSLQAYGPLSIFGFPTYYTDSNGLSLVHGVNVNDPLTPENLGLNDPALLADPNAPLDPTTGNFFEESFYFAADALVSTATGNALLVLAGGEAVWFTADGSVQDGFQTVFSRFRLFIDLPEFSGETRTYTITHPYGVKTFQVTSGGNRAIRFTFDTAVSPGFDSPLDGSGIRVDPFLVWTNNEAPAGYVGNPNVEHRVAGSPFGTNFFRIEGPDIGGAGINSVQTDFFNLAGKIIGIPTAPVASAGPDQSLVDNNNNGTENVILDGSGSFDLDGSISSYVWRKNNSQIASGVNPTVNLGVGSHTITLTVTDNDGNSDTDQVVIEVLQPTGNTFVLTMEVFPSGAGTTTPAVGTGHIFNENETVNISSTPGNGFIFGYWTGIPAVDASTVNSTVTMDANKTVTANFIELPPAAGETTASSLGLSGSLQAYGPLSIFSFPTYYTDSNGLSLVHGVDVNDPLMPEFFGLNDPALLPDPNAPLDITTGNFYTESFYFSASALIFTPDGRARLDLGGAEGVFLTADGSVQDGFQTVFNRFRVRIDLPSFSGVTRTYTVTHPYGVQNFEVTQGGNNAINFTLDSAVDVGFDTPLDGSLISIDPFLVWTNNEAPAGYVGDPNFDHTVTGSPFGTNVFRIEGPDIGGAGIDIVETDLFSISGKILPAGAGNAPAVLAKSSTNNAEEQSEESKEPFIPQEYSLEQNHPNPFNPSTKIAFVLPENVKVRLDIFNLLGQKIRTLVDDYLPAGMHSFKWDGQSDAGSQMVTGVYIYRLQTPTFVKTRKMLMVK